MEKYREICQSPNRAALSKSLLEKSFIEKQANVLSLFLKDLMGNQSYVVSGSRHCRQGAIAKKDAGLTGYHLYWNIYQISDNQKTQFPVYFRDRSQTLPFITCGQQESSAFPVKEFFKAYGKYVWISCRIVIIITTLVLGMPKSLGGQFQRQYFTAVFSIIKLLLEQSDPFSSRALDNRSLRPVLVCMLAGGLVVSNACKNTNVYNIITSRKVILYSVFEQLRKANFSIYSRLCMVERNY